MDDFDLIAIDAPSSTKWQISAAGESVFRRSNILLLFTFVLVVLVYPSRHAQAVPSSEKKPASLTIGFIPGENPATLRENGLELAKLLQAKIGLPVNVYVSKDYSGLIVAMKEKKVDFAFFSAMTYVFAEKMAGAKVLLKKVWTSPYYHSVLLTRSDSHLNKLSQLKGKKIAFVDEKSASGYLYPSVYFKKQGIDPSKYFSEVIYSGNHESSVKMLLDKKVDLIAVYANDKSSKNTAFTRFASKEIGHESANTQAQQSTSQESKVTTKSLWVSDPIPTDPFCVRADFYEQYPKTVHDLMFAFIEMQDDAASAPELRRVLGVSSLVLATSQQYEPVREMVRELNLKME